MSETVARARMFGFDGDWVALDRHHYDKHPEGDVVFYEVAEKLERERDEARKERDDSMEELTLMQKKLASLIRRWKGREKEYLNAVTLALEKGDKSASCRYHGESIGTHWAIEDLELILKRKEEA